jgi:hypothetical protein
MGRVHASAVTPPPIEYATQYEVHVRLVTTTSPDESRDPMPEMTRATGPRMVRRSSSFVVQARRTLTVFMGAVASAGVTACSVSLPSVLSSPTTAWTVPAESTVAPSTGEQSKLFADDFRGVCKGATVSRATAYDATAPAHKVILFSSYEGDLMEDTTTLPEDWMVQFDANGDAYSKVDTVACVEVKDEQPLKECTGYQNDGHDTANKVDLRLATYTVSVHEARTGKELGTTELDGSDDSCPTVVSFENDTETKVYDSPPSNDDMIAFLKPFMQP